jgi:hypothetical protein
MRSINFKEQRKHATEKATCTKKPMKYGNQEQHLDKNDFFTWKLPVSPLASL